GSAAPEWSEAALARLDEIGDASLRENLRLRAEKKARGERATVVAPAHVVGFLADAAAPRAAAPEGPPASGQGKLYWEAGALARLARVPEGFMRDTTRQRIENLARQQGADCVTLDRVEAGLAIARAAMAEERAVNDGGAASVKSAKGKCPFSGRAGPAPVPAKETPGPAVEWTAEATARLQAVPEGFCRTLTERAVATLASQNNLHRIDAGFLEKVLEVFQNGARSVETSLSWSPYARARIERAPDAVRGMLVREIEAWARRNGVAEVDESAVHAVKEEWQSRGVFHLEPGDPRGDV
ncbi:MAG: hypothetical protein WBO23_05690, partial [Burkholderiales bacterium]